jgi:hypothetical protein
MRTCKHTFFIPFAFIGIRSSSSAADDAKQPLPAWDVTLRPVREGGREVTAIDVRAEVRGGEFRGEQRLSIEAPVVYAGVAGIADRIRNVEIRDPSGQVPLTVGQDPPAQNAGYPYFRHWRADRDVTSPVTISYRSEPELGPFVMGPQFSFRAHDSGLSTAGSGFLAVPWGRGPATIRVKWDLSDLPLGSTAAATLGDGDFEVTGPTELLTQSFYMAGPLGRYVPDKQ